MTGRGPYIRTFTKKRFYIFDPRPEDFSITDVAHSHSISCRWTGHSSRAIPIGEHAINVAMLLGGTPEEYPGLLHEIGEVYLNDLNRPAKHAPELLKYREIEKEIERVGMAAFGVGPYDHSKVKVADDVVGGAEALLLMDVKPGEDEEFDKYVIPALAHPMYKDLEWSILNPPKDVKQDFLDYFYFLNGERRQHDNNQAAAD